MPFDRYFFPDDLHVNQHVLIETQEFHHLAKVMRAKAGDQVELVNGKWQLGEATIQTLHRHHAELIVTEVITKELNEQKPLVLAQALPRLNRLEYILEKGTELGATSFQLFPGMLSEKEEMSSNQLQRLKAITIAAMKQCGRLDLPAIHLKPVLEKWDQIEGAVFFGDTRENAPYPTKQAHQPVTLFIGPEKGLHPKEIQFLEAHLHAKGVRLHRNILRVDTATLVALTLLSTQ